MGSSLPLFGQVRRTLRPHLSSGVLRYRRPDGGSPLLYDQRLRDFNVT